MKKSLYIIFSFCTILFYSCKKKELPPENTDAGASVFYVKASVNGLPIMLDAGANDYYMNSAYYQDTNGVYAYKAELKQNNCSGNCGYAVTLLINDYQALAMGASMNVNAGLKTGSYIFNDNNLSPLYYSAKFTPVDAVVAGGTYNWTFSDGINFSGYECTRQFDAHKKYTATLSYAKDCSAELLNVFNIGNNLQTTVKADRDLLLIETLTYNFSTVSNNQATQAPYRYSWDFGDNSNIATDATPSHRYSTPGRYITKLQLIDANNDTCISYYQVSASFQKDCSANYTVAMTPIKNTKAFSAITVLITDPNGVVYSSKETVQPENSSFEIVSVEDYKVNSRNEPTKKITIKFNCTLKTGNGTIVLNNGEAVMAVSYK